MHMQRHSMPETKAAWPVPPSTDPQDCRVHTPTQLPEATGTPLLVSNHPNRESHPTNHAALEQLLTRCNMPQQQHLHHQWLLTWACRGC
jgi:hypothetical protein